jgi:acetyl-CoA acetyltransferase family protein
MTGVVITSAARTPIGSYGKGLKDVAATVLGVTAAKAAIERSGITPEQVEHTVIGNVIHSSTDDMYMGRVVSVGAGVPIETPAFTVNRLCGSGVQSIITAAMHIQTGDVDIALAGGAESMSQAPYWNPSGRWGARMGDTGQVDPVVGGLTDPFRKIHMGVTAENLSVRDTISREDQDLFAMRSHQKAAAARDAGKFQDQIAPVTMKTRKGDVVIASQSGATSAIIASGSNVAAIGGFSGSETDVSTKWLASEVAAGKIRWILTTSTSTGGMSSGRVGATAAMALAAKVGKSVSSVSGLYDMQGTAAALLAAA